MWLCFVFFVSALMFVLGIIIGRGTVPVAFDIDKLQKELAALKQESIEKQRSQAKIDSDDANGKTDLGFYEALKDSKNINKQNTGVSKPKTKPSIKKDVKKIKKKDTRAKAPPAKVIRKKKVSGLSKKEPGEKKLTIQAASLKDSKDADRIVAKLKSKGYPAYKVIGVIPDKGIWFRVRVGAYENWAEASGTMERLKKDGFEAFLVNR